MLENVKNNPKNINISYMLNSVLNNKDLSDNFKGDTEKLQEWNPKDIESLKSISLEVPVTDKSIKLLKKLALREYLLYLVRLVILTTLLCGVDYLAFMYSNRIFALFILMGSIIGAQWAYKPYNVMKCSLGNIKFYNKDTRCFVIAFDSRYKESDTRRGIIVNNLFINLTHDNNYFDLENEDAILLYLNPDGNYLIQQADQVIKVGVKK